MNLTPSLRQLAPQLENGSEDAAMAFGVGCPVCGDTVRVTLSDLERERPVQCRAGHPLAVTSCAGLADVIAFIRTLERAARRLEHPHAES